MRIDQIEFEARETIPRVWWVVFECLFESGNVLHIEHPLFDHVEYAPGYYCNYMKGPMNNWSGSEYYLKQQRSLAAEDATRFVRGVFAKEKVVRVLRGKLLGPEYSHLQQLPAEVTPEAT